MWRSSIEILWLDIVVDTSFTIDLRAASIPNTDYISIIWLLTVRFQSIPSNFNTSLNPIPDANKRASPFISVLVSLSVT